MPGTLHTQADRTTQVAPPHPVSSTLPPVCSPSQGLCHLRRARLRAGLLPSLPHSCLQELCRLPAPLLRGLPSVTVPASGSLCLTGACSRDAAGRGCSKLGSRHPLHLRIAPRTTFKPAAEAAAKDRRASCVTQAQRGTSTPSGSGAGVPAPLSFLGADASRTLIRSIDGPARRTTSPLEQGMWPYLRTQHSLWTWPSAPSTLVLTLPAPAFQHGRAICDLLALTASTSTDAVITNLYHRGGVWRTGGQLLAQRPLTRGLGFHTSPASTETSPPGTALP